MSGRQLHVFVCTGPVCGNEGVALHRAARRLASTAEGESGTIEVHREVCLGYCHQGPNVMLCFQADPWGRAPLPGSEGSVSLHEMTEAKLAEVLRTRPAPCLLSAETKDPRAAKP